MTESAPKRRRSLSQEAPSKRPALGTLSADPSPTQWNIDLPADPLGSATRNVAGRRYH
jgi:hypothetical protein